MQVHKPSILVVAPPSRLRDSLQAMLKAFVGDGYVVKTVEASLLATKGEALAPALMFLDADVIPDKDCYEDAWPQTPVVVLASNSQQRQASVARCAHAVLMKGFNSAELSEVLTRILPPEANI